MCFPSSPIVEMDLLRYFGAKVAYPTNQLLAIYLLVTRSVREFGFGE